MREEEGGMRNKCGKQKIKYDLKAATAQLSPLLQQKRGEEGDVKTESPFILLHSPRKKKKKNNNGMFKHHGQKQFIHIHIYTYFACKRFKTPCDMNVTHKGPIHYA